MRPVAYSVTTDAGSTVRRMSTPPERLEVEREQLRERGLRFKQAAGRGVESGARRAAAQPNVRRETRREQKAIWAVSYSRAPRPIKDRPTLDPSLLLESATSTE